MVVTYQKFNSLQVFLSTKCNRVKRKEGHGIILLLSNLFIKVDFEIEHTYLSNLMALTVGFLAQTSDKLLLVFRRYVLERIFL